MFKYIYHLSHTDLDGFGCHAVSRILTEGKDSKVFYCNANYGSEVMSGIEEIFDSILEIRHRGDMENILVLITDLNLSHSEAEYLESERLFHKNVEVVLLDHHISGKEVADNYSWYNLDTTKSGTLLTKEWLEKQLATKSKEVEYLVNIIDTYDLWKESEPIFEFGRLCSFYLNMITKFIPLNDYRKEHDEVARRFVTNLTQVKNDEDFLKLLREQIIAYVNDVSKTEKKTDNLPEAIESIMVEDIVSDLNGLLTGRATILNEVDDKKLEIAIYLAKSHISSSVMNKVLKRLPKLNAIAVVNDSGIMSLRSTGKLDVSKLAKGLGGGGHKCAAGCKLNRKDKSSIKEYVEYVTNKICDFYLYRGEDNE